MSELLVKSESLTAVADSIRSKAGSTEELVFPEGFVSAVERIEVGIDKIKEALVSIGIEVGDGDTSTEVAEKIAENGFPIQYWNVRVDASNSAAYLFYDCDSLTTVPLFDTSKVTDMSYMFYDCDSLTTVPLFDTSKVTNMSYMFCGCDSLTTTPLFDTSKVINMYYMFRNCRSLTNVPEFDTSSVSSMSNMFSCCYQLTTVPLFDTSNVTNMEDMFSYDYRLTTVPLFNTTNVTRMYGMFNGCKALTTVPQFDMRNVTHAGGMLSNCTSLTECWLRNINVSLTVGFGTGSHWGHLLTVESLLHLIKECRDTGSTKTLTIGTANMEKLANIYVKVIDITDEMRAEDDLIDEKLPFVVCDSTDEGAMLITDYVLEKNWQLE